MASGEEIWKPIKLDAVKDYKPNKYGCVATLLNGYEASSLGRIRKPNGELKSIITRKSGYQLIHILIGHKHKQFHVHRLVAAAFHQVRDGVAQTLSFEHVDGIPYIVNHLDENPGNNCEYNLEWCDDSMNIAYTYSRFNNSRGLKVFMTNLETNVVTTFRSTREISRYFNIAQSTASELLWRKTIPYLGKYLFKPENPEQHKLRGVGVNIEVAIRDCESGAITIVSSCPEASEFSGVKNKTVYYRLMTKANHQEPFNGYQFLSVDELYRRTKAFNNGEISTIWPTFSKALQIEKMDINKAFS